MPGAGGAQQQRHVSIPKLCTSSGRAQAGSVQGHLCVLSVLWEAVLPGHSMMWEPWPSSVGSVHKAGCEWMCQARSKPCSTNTGSKPLPTSLGDQFCSRRSWQLSAQQCSQMKELLLPEPSGNSGAPVRCCLPAQAPCQTLAGSVHAAPALSPETALLTTVELFAHHITS